MVTKAMVDKNNQSWYWRTSPCYPSKAKKQPWKSSQDWPVYLLIRSMVIFYISVDSKNLYAAIDPWNILRHSFCTRLLYTVLPYPYSKENLAQVLELMVDDLNKLYESGITVAWIRKWKYFSMSKVLDITLLSLLLSLIRGWGRTWRPGLHLEVCLLRLQGRLAFSQSCLESRDRLHIQSYLSPMQHQGCSV